MVETELVHEADGDLGPRSMEVRERILEESQKIDESYQVLAQLLHECYANSYFIRWGFKNFQDYCESEGLHYRRSNYLVGIAQVIEDLGIEWDDIEGVGWTKMRALIPILKEQGEVADWLDLAKVHSVKELEALVKQSKIGMDVSITGGDTKVHLTLSMTTEQGEAILGAIDEAKIAFEVQDNVLALECLCMEYVQYKEDASDKIPLERVIDFAEKNYGVELAVMGRQEIEDIVAEGGETHEDLKT